MSFRKDFKDVLLKVIAGLFVALIIAICQYFYKHPDFHLSWVLLSPMQLLEDIYFRFSIPMRLNIYFWLNTFFIYYILDKYDQNYEVDKKRTVKEHNFNSGSFLIYSLFVSIGLLNIGQFKLIENEIGIFIINAFGLLATFTGFLILVLGRVALDGRWGPHIYNYSDNSLRKLVTKGIYSKMRHPIYLGQSIMAFSTFLCSNSYLFVIFPIVVMFINNLRAINEEKFLSIEFDQEFTDYKHKVSKWWLY